MTTTTTTAIIAIATVLLPLLLLLLLHCLRNQTSANNKNKCKTTTLTATAQLQSPFSPKWRLNKCTPKARRGRCCDRLWPEPCHTSCFCQFRRQQVTTKHSMKEWYKILLYLLQIIHETQMHIEICDQFPNALTILSPLHEFYATQR